ncbi:MAG: carboxymuconolactone decarboxylase [Methanosphaera stadtmanae]|nr:carboxymuconolactone decarboxylase [Methanosphaera stadtmanae]
MNKKLELISNYDSSLKETDPELTLILDNFLLKQVFEESILSDKERLIVTLACLVSNQSLNLYENVVKVALDIGVTPVEIKEILYQSLAYIGLSKTYDFIKKTNEIFNEYNINLPLENQATINYDDRLEVGYDIQVRNFGKEFIDNSIQNCPEGQKHIWDFISSYAFGDFYSRNGLEDNLRELISFTFIMSLRGCENQLRIHTKGNLEIGNSKEKLISVITVLVPYLGFPRVHNALAILNEICD